MANYLSRPALVRSAVSVFTLVCFLMASSAFAQTAGPRVYGTELIVPDGKKSVQTDADITFSEKIFRVVPDKAKYAGEIREIAYADIKSADHSFSKKPMLSGGGAVATALLVGFIFAIPFLFIKKKNHWLTIQAGEKFCVLKMGGDNFRQIIAEFESHKVTVNDLKDESK